MLQPDSPACAGGLSSALQAAFKNERYFYRVSSASAKKIVGSWKLGIDRSPLGSAVCRPPKTSLNSHLFFSPLSLQFPICSKTKTTNGTVRSWHCPQVRRTLLPRLFTSSAQIAHSSELLLRDSFQQQWLSVTRGPGKPSSASRLC